MGRSCSNSRDLGRGGRHLDSRGGSRARHLKWTAVRFIPHAAHNSNEIYCCGLWTVHQGELGCGAVTDKERAGPIPRGNGRVGG